jgi:hypothetical protein
MFAYLKRSKPLICCTQFNLEISLFLEFGEFLLLKVRLHCVRFLRENADGSVYPSVIARISTWQM